MIRLFTIVFISFLSTTTLKAEVTSIDAVIAIVGDDIITRNEMDARKDFLTAEISGSGRNLPPEPSFSKQVLDVMIDESVLEQEASRRGIRVSDGQLNQTVQRVARGNNMSLSQFREVIINEGMSYESYRSSLRKDLKIQTLRRQYTSRTVSISDNELNEFIALSGEQTINYDYKISHILISLPDAAAPEEVEKAQNLTNEVMNKLRLGAEFESLASEYSTGSSALQGGDLGWRMRAEIPSLFAEEVISMKPGDFRGPLRSASGFHIVYLKERKDTEQVLSKQIRTRHILMRSDEMVTEQDVQKRLDELRQKVVEGADFAELAEANSVDYGSAVQGGDIGWSGDGDTVPEYQEVMKSLDIGEISDPFRSQFGWHLLEVTGHRTMDETEENKRSKIRQQLLVQKQKEAFDIWKRQLRAETFVEIPEA